MSAQEKILQPAFGGINQKTADLPSNIDAEESVLGGILLDPEAIERVADILYPEAFYINAHREIFKAALNLHSSGKTVDLVAVTTYLDDHKLLAQVGGVCKLANLLEATVSALNIDRHAQLILDKYQRREIIHAGRKVTDLGFSTESDLEDICDQAENAVYGATNNSSSFTVERPLDILLRIVENAGKRIRGISTGLVELDELTGGLKKKKVYIVAGRSGMGKTHFAIHLVSQALVQMQAGSIPRGAIVCFSAEMDRDAWMSRLVSWRSGLDSRLIQEGRVESDEDFEALGEAVVHLAETPLWVDDTPGAVLTPSRIRSGIRKATSEYGKPVLIVLDYLQLLGSESAEVNRVAELDKIANSLKGIAKKFDVPFVALAQINRTVEGQKDKRPVVSQLRESGAIEQVADAIMLLYRDEYYNPRSRDRGICEVILGKHRDGQVGTVASACHLETSRFEDLDE